VKIVDLTVPLDSNTLVFPGNPKILISSAATIEKDGCNVLSLSLSSHVGTHIDAPFHFIKNGKKLSDFEPGHFVGQAVVIDCRGQKEISLDRQALSIIQPDDIVFLFTGHTDAWNTERYYSDYPTLSKPTAKALVAKQVKFIGVDSPSPDKKPFPLHYIFLEKDILIIENLTHLHGLVGKRFQCIVAPLKIENADGAPCRVLGIVD